MTHAELIQRAVHWLRGSQRCSVVFAEMDGHMGLIPDAIGWQVAYRWSILVECKTSRADFKADQKKLIHRNPEGYPGQERLYLTPPALLSVEELPEGWGLIEAHPNCIRVVHRLWNPKAVNLRPINPERQAAESLFLLTALSHYQNPDFLFDSNTETFVYRPYQKKEKQ